MQADQDRPIASIRLAQAEDAAGIARVHVESWRDAYSGVLPDRHLLNLDPERHAIGWTRSLARADDRRHTLVAVADDEVVGFATFGPAREGRPSAEGEIYMLYVATDWRELGIGRQLVQAAFVAMWEMGSKAASIWCLEENHAAIGFYKRIDGKRISAPRQERVGGADFPVIGFSWSLFN
ncbi:GNAT family N-acetyltransferase [Dongia rigui]|uniref:GNAT family N-acetyltransferase n=1 Tax=Dongia rigui TaxID=940149 RepID=A0ABU5E5Z9_9PROT|nr:GNAT family N-acetyltransferase [Dongia rigui]MDY0874383.1 GNAT family N-acetyltransferase [Dongia rigui]